MKNRGNKTGSFGIPEEMQEAINKSKEKANKKEEKPEYRDSESIPEEFEEKAKEEDSKSEKPKEEMTDEEKLAQQQEEEKEIAEEIKKDLGIELDEDDLWSFYFKNNLEKSNITIVPGKVYATFSTISMDDNDAINEALAKGVEKRLLDVGLQNLRVKYTLAYGLKELGKEGKLKPLGGSPEDRLDALGKMNTMMIDKLQKKWNKFIWLVEYTVSKEMEVKN